MFTIHEILAEIFLIWENQNMFWFEGMFEFVQKLLLQSFLLSFKACDKNWPFLILYEKYFVFMHYLPDKKLGYFYVPGLDWLAGIIVTYNLDLSKKCSSFVRIIKVSPLKHHTFTITADSSNFLNSLFCTQIDTQTQGNFCIGASSINAKQHSIVSKFQEDWIALWCFFPHRECLTDSSLLCSRQNLNQRRHMHKIDNLRWQFTNCTLYSSIFYCILWYSLYFFHINHYYYYYIFLLSFS